jgi:hypothetical protein
MDGQDQSNAEGSGRFEKIVSLRRRRTARVYYGGGFETSEKCAVNIVSVAPVRQDIDVTSVICGSRSYLR